MTLAHIKSKGHPHPNLPPTLHQLGEKEADHLMWQLLPPHLYRWNATWSKLLESNFMCFKTLVKTEISFSLLPSLTPKLSSLEEITGDEKR
jgi:hypothetical protein